MFSMKHYVYAFPDGVGYFTAKYTAGLMKITDQSLLFRRWKLKKRVKK